MEMQIGMPSSSIHWLSELGMDDPLLAKSIDGLFSPVDLSALGNDHHLDYKGSAVLSFQRPDAQKRPISSIMTHNLNMPMQNGASYERFSKVPKLDPWDVSCSQQLHGDITSLLQPSSRHHLGGMKQQHTSPHRMSALENFLASFPALKDENIAPTTPSLQFEMGVSHGSAGARQESSITDVHSVVSTATKEPSSLSPSSSLCGGGHTQLGYLPMHKALQGSSAPSFKTGNSQDHIMAERKRREKLSQRFIALSAIVPGLKKMDKASVLGDAIKYVKHLQERLKTIEEQAPKMVSIAKQKSSRNTANSDSISDSSMENSSSHQQPDIEVRMVDKKVLIRVHCEKRKGLLLKSFGELERLQLSVHNANILSFTETTLDLTFTAEVEEGFALTADDIVKALHDFFKQLM